MTDWYLRFTQRTRELRRKAYDCMDAHADSNKTLVAHLKDYMRQDVGALKALWPKDVKTKFIDNLARHVSFGTEGDIDDMLRRDIPGLEEDAERYFRANSTSRNNGFQSLLHPKIIDSSYAHFDNGDFRNAVLDAIIAVFDHLRYRTGLTTDGAQLVGNAFGGDEPLLVFSEIATESGKNDQAGFLQIFQGAFRGIRNPKAHTLEHDLNRTKAAQYLVFASLLARRIDEAHLPAEPQGLTRSGSLTA